MNQHVSELSGATPVVTRKPSIKNTSSMSDQAPPTENAKSAAAEIPVLPIAKPDPVGDAIKCCKEGAKGGSVFKLATAQIFEGLQRGYLTFVLIKDNEAEHQRVIKELMSHGNRERMPSLRKAAYNATVLACHPDNPGEWTLSSDWSNVLVHADLEQVLPVDFHAWVEDKSIRVSKQKVRAAKKASKPLKTLFVVGDFPALAHVLEHGDEPARQLMKDELTKLDDLVCKALAASNVVVA